MAKEKLELTGSIQLEIDASGTQARLMYQPKPDGETWTYKDILKLLSDNNVVEGFTEKQVQDTIKKLQKNQDESTSAVIAKGDEPELPEPEKYTWSYRKLPDNLKDTAEKTFSDAGAPQITKTTTQKVKKKKQVEKKPAFPFMRPGTKEITVTETETIEEPVVVDPEVLDTGYIYQGNKIADIQKGQPGSPGISIYGEPIPPLDLDETAIFTGKGIKREKDQLIAEQTGFVRRGKNWVELVPFQTHYWNIHLSEDKSTCYLSFKPGNPSAPIPNYKEILETIEEQGYDTEDFIDEDELNNILVEAATDQTPFDNFPLTRDRDGSYSINVSSDGQTATLTLKKGKGRGKPLKLQEAGTAITKSGIKNLNLDKIKKDILAFYKSKQTELPDYVLAEGTPPKRGKGRHVECQVTTISEEERDEIKERITENPDIAGDIGSLEEFPIENVEKMAPVDKKQHLGEIKQEEKDIRGIDVYGKPIAPPEDEDPEIQLCENLIKEKNVITSTIRGILDYGKQEGVSYLRVRPHRNAEVCIEITHDNMQAYLTITPHQGSGKPVTQEQVNEAIQEKGIQKGLKEEAVEHAIQQARQGEEVDDELIAEGQLPKNSVQGRMKFHVKFSKKHKLGGASHIPVPAERFKAMVLIKKGETIAEILPPQDESDEGWDVLGNALTGTEESNDQLEIGKNVTKGESPSGSTLLRAEKGGEVLFDGRKIEVEELCAIKSDIDTHTGNIKFPGDITINGSLKSGYYVISEEGRVQIDEFAEKSLISCHNDIIIKKGIKGGGKGVLRTKQSIKTAYVEQAALLAVQDITVANNCFKSRIKCNGKLTLESSKGTIIGGSIRARKGIETAVIGNKSGIETTISFGQDYLIMDQIEAEEREIEKLKNRISKIDVEMKKYEKEDNREKLFAVRKEKLKLMKLMEKRGMRLFNLRERFEEHFPSEIRVSDTVFPGVTLESHGRTLKIVSKKSRVAFYFDNENGHIKEKSL